MLRAVPSGPPGLFLLMVFCDKDQARSATEKPSATQNTL